MVHPVFGDAAHESWYQLGPEASNVAGIQMLAEEARRLAHDLSVPPSLALIAYVLSSVLSDLLPVSNWPEQGVRGEYYDRLGRHLFPAVRKAAKAIADERTDEVAQDAAYGLIAAHRECISAG